MMGIPRELTLVKTEKGYLLRQKLVQELEEQKVKNWKQFWIRSQTSVLFIHRKNLRQWKLL